MVDKHGYVPKKIKKTERYYDEIVIPQESQITPVFVLRLRAEQNTDMSELKRDSGSFGRSRKTEV